MTKAIIAFCQVLLFTAVGVQAFGQTEIKTVVIDAGHGGHDPGNLGTGRYRTTEKDVSLDVALKLGEYIKDAFPSIKVVYTRSDDRFIPLNERANIANRSKADLMISIHCNSAKATSAAGTETWVMGLHRSKENLEVAMRENSVILLEDNYESTYSDFNPRDPDSYIAMSLMQSAYLDQSVTLAAKIQEDFQKRVGRVNRGIKQGGLLVLYKSAMPAILIELGFLTNA
ncbi:MAG TPA: N-acetylmuramoyl-L-alanine amidase, partial [Luteibaculaceae bacterium]|nr:N-acetylmuramoyl-L-alanine amidase [Luteibaculaceae bacterium]